MEVELIITKLGERIEENHETIKLDRLTGGDHGNAVEDILAYHKGNLGHLNGSL